MLPDAVRLLDICGFRSEADAAMSTVSIEVLAVKLLLNVAAAVPRELLMQLAVGGMYASTTPPCAAAFVHTELVEPDGHFHSKLA